MIKKCLIPILLLTGCNTYNQQNDDIPLYDEFVDVYITNTNNLPYVFETMELLPKRTQVKMLIKLLMSDEPITDKNRQLIIKQVNILNNQQ